MTMELTENTIGIWAVSIGQDSDWLASVWRDGDDYILAYRFRYYEDDKTFDSADRKNWYKAKVPVAKIDQAKLIRIMQSTAELLWKAGGGKRYELLMDSGGIERLMHDLAEWPMISMLEVEHSEPLA